MIKTMNITGLSSDLSVDIASRRHKINNIQLFFLDYKARSQLFLKMRLPSINKQSWLYLRVIKFIPFTDKHA